MASSAATELPRLAYVYHPQSFPPLTIAETAREVCSLIWIVDGADPATAGIVRFLRRSGTVIDRAGAELVTVAAQVRAERPDGVLSMHDGDLVWTAQLAAELGLPFHSVSSAVRLTDKVAQRAALAAGGLTVPATAVIAADATPADVDEIAERFSYPAVIKPRLGQASRDTLPIDSAAALRDTVAAFRADPEQPAEEYILEGFIPDSRRAWGGEGFANMVSVESLVEDGRIVHAGLSARTPFRWPFRETGFCTPCDITAEMEAAIHRVATEAARAMEVQVGALHTEVKLTDDGPVIIEVNGRPGGGKSEMLERASGFSILQAALKLAVGAPVGLRGPVPCGAVAYQLYVFGEDDFDCIDAVEGLDALGALPSVDEVVLRRGPGERIDWREGSQAHVFNFAGTVASHDELRALMAELPSIVTIRGHDDPA